MTDDVEDVLKNPEDVPKAENLIDALIEDGKNGQPKIHFTWVPTRPGRLSELPEMMEARDRIGDIVYNGLDYVDVTADDFGYPFSPEARELETFILREIDSSTRKQMYRRAEEFRVFWAKKLTDPSTTDVGDILRDLRDAKDLLQPLIQAESSDVSLPKTKDLMRDVLEIFQELGIQSRSESVDLQAFEDQDRFLDLLQKVHGSVPSIDQKKWIQPFQRALTYIQAAIDWFQTLTELDRKLCLIVVGNSSEPCESSSTTTTYVDDKNFRQVVATLKQKFGTAIPNVPIKKFNTDYKSLTVKFLNGIIHRMSATRTRIVHAFVADTALATRRHFLKDDQGLTPEEFKRTMARVADAFTKVVRLPSDGTVTPNRLLMEIQAAFTSAGSDNILSPESIEIMRHQVAITQFLVAAGSPGLEKLSRSDTLAPLERATAFFTQAIDWFNFLDQLQQSLSAYKVPSVQQVTHDSVAEANYLVRKAILPALEELAAIMELQMPRNDSMDPTYFNPFVSHLNDILFRAWSRRKDYMMSLLEELARGMISVFRSKTSCQENVTAFRSQVPEFIQIIEDKELSLGSNSLPQQTSPVELVELYEDILSPLRQVGPPSFGVNHLQKIRDQQEVFRVLAQVTPTLADVDMTRASRKLQPVTFYLRHLESWYGFMNDLQSNLVGDASVLDSSLEFDPSKQVLGVNETTWYNFLQQSANFCHLPPPPTAKNVLDEQGAMCFVNAVANAAYKSSSTLLKTNMRRLVNKLQESSYLKAQLSQEAARFIQFMSTLSEQFNQIMANTAYDNVTLVKSFVHDLDTRLGSVNGIGNDVLETLTTVKEQSSIFELLKLVSAQFSSMSTRELTSPLYDVIVFINDAIKWFEYLQQLDIKLSTYELHLGPTATNSTLTNPMYQASGQPGKVLEALQQFSTLLNVSQPLVSPDVPDRDVFLRQASRIFHRAWTQRTEEVTASTKALARSIIQHYYKLTRRPEVVELKDATLKALQAFKDVASSDDLDPSLQSAGAFANLLSTTLTDLGIPMNPGLTQLLTHMAKQDEVLGIVGQVSYAWSRIDLRMGLRMLGSLTEYLDHTYNWFQFLCDLESHLGRYALKTFRIMPESIAQQAPTRGVQHPEAAYQLVQQFASVLKLHVPADLEMILENTDRNGMLRYVDLLILWTHQTRVDEIKQLVEETSGLLVRHIATRSANGSLEAPNYKDFVQSTKNRLKHLCESASESMDSRELAHYIEQGLLDMFQTTESFKEVLDLIAKQDEILHLLTTVKPEFGKIDSRAALSPLQDVTFLTDSLIWYEFLDKLAAPLCSEHQPKTRPAMVWLTAENSLGVLSSLSQKYSVPLPRRGVSTSQETVFLREVNNLVYCAWDLRMTAVVTLVGQLADNITTYYEARADNLTNFQAFLSELENATVVFSQFQELRHNKNYRPRPSVLAQNISTNIKKIGLNLGDDILKQIEDYEESFTEFAAISADLSTLNPEPCFAALEGVSKYLDRTVSWYEFLSTVDARLSRHEAQRDIESYRDACLGSLPHGNYSEYQLTELEDVTKFVNNIVRRLYIAAPREFQELFNTTGPIPALRHMNDLLHRTLLDPMQCSTSNNILTITGHYVLLSREMSCLPGKNLERMVINAHHTLFIDTEINALRVNNKNTFDIVVIANSVYSVSGHTIDLSGFNARGQQRGAAGSPGLAGENGGSFFLISTSVTGSFTLVTNGGKGSDGLAGSNGQSGSDGQTPTASEWGQWADPVCNPLVKPDFQIETPFRYKLIREICLSPGEICTGKAYKVYGKDGEAGTSGGHGGQGGAGGTAGLTKIMILDNTTSVQSRVMVTREAGQAGADGLGGKGGPGGLNGDDLLVALTRIARFNRTPFARRPKPSFSVSWTCTTDARIYPVRSESAKRAPSGVDGITGGNPRSVAPPSKETLSLRDVQNHVAVYLGAYEGSVGMDVFVKPAHQGFIQLLRGVQMK